MLPRLLPGKRPIGLQGALACIYEDWHARPDQAGHDGMTTEKILAALDKPRKLYSILMVVNPSGSSEELQQKLLKMRDEGLVKFDIHKGRWYLPN